MMLKLLNDVSQRDLRSKLNIIMIYILFILENTKKQKIFYDLINGIAYLKIK